MSSWYDDAEEERALNERIMSEETNTQMSSGDSSHPEDASPQPADPEHDSEKEETPGEMSTETAKYETPKKTRVIKPQVYRLAGSSKQYADITRVVAHAQLHGNNGSGRNGLLMSAYYHCANIPFTIKVDTRSISSLLSNKEGIMNLQNVENVGPFGIAVYRAVYHGLTKRFTEPKPPSHDCKRNIGSKMDPDICCSFCLPYLFKHYTIPSMKAMNGAQYASSHSRIDSILNGFLIVGKAYSAPQLQVSTPEDVLFVPHHVSAKLNALKVFQTFQVECNLANEVQFRSDSTSIPHEDFAIMLALYHLNSPMKLLMGRVVELCLHGKFRFKLPNLVNINHPSRLVAVAHIPKTVQDTYCTTTGLPINFIPMLKFYAHVGNDRVMVSPDAYKRIASGLSYYYSKHIVDFNPDSPLRAQCFFFDLLRSRGLVSA